MLASRSELFRVAAARVETELAQRPDDIALQSILQQLKYLIGLDAGVHKDRSRLKDVIIGYLAGRELDGVISEDLIELLSEVSFEAKRM
jgi:hypothetical protein